MSENDRSSSLPLSAHELLSVLIPVLSRREFIGVTLGATIASGVLGEAAWSQTKGDIPYRELGRTGEKLSAIGIGGYHIGIGQDEQESVRIVRTAVDGGINFLDNCWDYHNGESELRMGKALRDGYRQRVFLMSKIDGRTKESAARQSDQSL